MNIRSRFFPFLFDNHAEFANPLHRQIPGTSIFVMYVLNPDLSWLRIHRNEDELENVSDRLSLPNEQE